MKDKQIIRGLLCVVDDKTEIWADKNGYILRFNIIRNEGNRVSYDHWYYSSLEMAVQDIFELKFKEFATSYKNPTLKTVGESIRKAHDYIIDTLNPLLYGYGDKSKK